MPNIFIFFSQNIAQGSYRLINFFNPFYNNSHCNYAWIFSFSIENCLTGKTIRPSLRIWWHEAWIWRSPCSFIFPTQTPMKHKVVKLIRISCNKINRKSMILNLDDFFFSIIIVIYIFFWWWWRHSRILDIPLPVKCWLSIFFLFSILFLTSISWKRRTIIW